MSHSKQSGGLLVKNGEKPHFNWDNYLVLEGPLVIIEDEVERNILVPHYRGVTTVRVHRSEGKDYRELE